MRFLSGSVKRVNLTQNVRLASRRREKCKRYDFIDFHPCFLRLWQTMKLIPELSIYFSFLTFRAKIRRTSALLQSCDFGLTIYARIFFPVINAPTDRITAAVITAVNVFGIDV